jgi:hypothetical protein
VRHAQRQLGENLAMPKTTKPPAAVGSDRLERSISSNRLAAGGPIARAALLAIALICTSAWADNDNGSDTGPAALRGYIGAQVGGIGNLQVPATNAGIPVPRAADGSVPYRYETTEAKRYLGKLLFHDPVRTVRVDINTGQPKDLPTGTSFGGTMDATDPRLQAIFPGTDNIIGSQVQSILDATKQTGSCGACHIGEAAGKAGQQLNFNVGGEGRGYTDEKGRFFPRRRPQSILVPLRTTPLFKGDVLADALPTLTDIWVDHGNEEVTTPAYFYHYPNPPGALNTQEASADPNLQLLATGRLDQLDSVARMSPSMVGFAFNNRLLLGGFAGNPPSTPGSLNVDPAALALNPTTGDPAQDNLTLLLLDAHRMLNFQAAALRQIPTFVKLFRDAFPQEAAADTGDLTTLVSDDTELRAQATFLRTVVTRNTPFDRFLAGDDQALTPAQRRGARLFFTPAASGAGGAGCFSCHSGPMLNKQPNDPDVTGVGAYIEENFFNVGIGDHPIQALNALARGHLDSAKLGTDGYPYHAEDNGRQEITHNLSDAFKFRVLTMRQLKDGRNFTHNGSFTTVREVVEYFNAGVPQDPTAGAAPTFTTRFTNPRGSGYPAGLGLSEQQVDNLTDFLENALYDPALVNYDPNSSTDTLQPNVRDLTYSRYRPDLAALGAKDGFMLSSLAIDDNDPLTRRDEGLEFLNVTSQARIAHRGHDLYSITNNGTSLIDTNLIVVVTGLPRGARLLNASGITTGASGYTPAGDPYVRLFLRDGVLNPGEHVVVRLQFTGEKESNEGHSFVFLSGQGVP